MKNQTRRPIGFQTSYHDKPTICESAQSEYKELPNNRYLDAIMMAFREFVIEECKGYDRVPGALTKKIEAARLLYREERKALARNYAGM